jgi:hypothetical protein
MTELSGFSTGLNSASAVEVMEKCGERVEVAQSVTEAQQN